MSAPKISMQSPWLAVTIGLAGLVIGYAVVLGRTGGLAFAASVYSCPAKQICTGDSCKKNPHCASGVCSKDCPGNCKDSI